MLKIKKTLMFFLLCGLTVGAFSQTNERTLSLDECIKTALQNNLGVAVEILNPEIADASIALARERFLPQLSMRYFTQNTNTPSFSWIDSSDQLTTDYNNYVAYFEQNLPFGTNITATLFSYQNETNQRFQTINPRFGSTLQFDVTQPLLKNFGSRVNRREIIIAKNSREMSDSQLKQVLLETVYNVEEAYWNLVFSIEDLRVRHQSLSLARDLLKKIEEKSRLEHWPLLKSSALRPKWPPGRRRSSRLKVWSRTTKISSRPLSIWTRKAPEECTRLFRLIRRLTPKWR